jgi:NADPH-dependent glutamate synthase beta subunit-like oxidoreductase/formate hydrogenlyase subunit 6/NADH:ubiquinone oxidoreductase subunit I
MTKKQLLKKDDKRVLLVGLGYGALKVAEDLAHSGIPVVWVTQSAHFLEIPMGTDSFVEWPDDINFQFRPLYLRVTRHPLVTPLTHARIEKLEQDGDLYSVTVAQDPKYIDYDLCTGCGRCMEVCPLNDSELPPLTRSPAYCPSRAVQLDKRKLCACRTDCPLGVNVQAYMALAATSRFEEALRVIKEDNPLPGICGRVCHHPCEEACRRNDLDQAVAIRDIKRFLSDWEATHGVVKLGESQAKARDERVAIVGSGPAGLTAAHFLNRHGFKVTIFEALPLAGGMLRAGINAFRLPRHVLDAEIEALEESGVKIRTSSTVDSLDKLLKKNFNAVLLCTGTHADLRLNIPGEEIDGVVHCVEFLSGVNLYDSGEVGRRTIVIGAGNSAMDAARTALRLGAESVTILAIETEEQMPAHHREVREASEEGVAFRLAAAPVKFEDKDGKLSGVTCRPAHWSGPDKNGAMNIVFDSDETFFLEADTIIVSIGQRPHIEETGLKLETGRGSRVVVDKSMATSHEGVFAAGDVVTGPSTVIDSMAAGRRAAGKVIEYITGKPSPFSEITPESRGVGEYIDISEDVPRRWRPEMAERQPRARRRDFDEVAFGFTAEQAVAESARCLQCGACCECRVCESVCEDIEAIDHFRKPRKFRFKSPTVIVADPQELPENFALMGDGIHFANGPREKLDMMDLLAAGSAAAGKAMVDSISIRRPNLPETIQTGASGLDGGTGLGFFVCSCNATTAPEGVLERIRDMADKIPEVRHSEIIVSACHPRGADKIARTIKKKRLGRIILASCVCCPLEFQCISCNDQRTRARIHLFDGLGLERSRFEMVNFKDHLGSIEQTEDELFEGARVLLRSAFIRARVLGPLRQGTTDIGKNILIIGGSETGVSCALNLDLQGFKVRLIHRARPADGPAIPKQIKKRLTDLTAGRRIKHIQEAEIEGIEGHVGDFKIALTVDGKHHLWHADAICLTDDNVAPLTILEELTGLKKLYRYNFSFFHTPHLGIYRVNPRTLERLSAFEAGAALAAEVATATAEAFLKDHELSPRVDPERCRGCQRCADICPFNAIKMVPTTDGVYTAEIVRHNCVGCGGCVGRCPVTAMDIPYFSNEIITDLLVNTLAGDR